MRRKLDALGRAGAARFSTRREQDSFGFLEVPAEAYWGAQTQRSIQNFDIGGRMPDALIKALVLVKKACARANTGFGLDAGVAAAIERACDDVLEGRVGADQFPLVIYQTGSGTQTNMNVNEVIANRAAEICGGTRGDKRVHPNDHVNRAMSSNDTFPTAMHVAAVLTAEERLLPALAELAARLGEKAEEFADIVKIGRTHTQDATPITLGQEFGGYAAQVARGIRAVRAGLEDVRALAQGGTAVGTGLNCFEGFDRAVAAELSALTGQSFVPAANKFEALASNDALTYFHGALAGLATALHKVANDVRFLASGPRSGLGELSLPENEPGSSIMPGKVNPTQCEALTMVAARVLGNDTTVAFCNTQGHFELNVYRPVVASCVLESIELLAQASRSFARHCVAGIRPNRARIAHLLDNSLMLVTALNSHIGYDKAALIAKYAHTKDISLRAAALELKLVSGEDFDAWVRPEEMLRPRSR